MPGSFLDARAPFLNSSVPNQHSSSILVSKLQHTSLTVEKIVVLCTQFTISPKLNACCSSHIQDYLSGSSCCLVLFLFAWPTVESCEAWQVSPQIFVLSHLLWNTWIWMCPFHSLGPTLGGRYSLPRTGRNQQFDFVMDCFEEIWMGLEVPCYFRHLVVWHLL